MTIYENLFVGRELRTRFGTLDRRAMAKQAREMLETFGVEIDPRRRMGNLSIALVQLVEIAKATTWGAKVLLLDEPTSAIPDREVERLYEVVRTLKQQGVAMLYTTHRMAEIPNSPTTSSCFATASWCWMPHWPRPHPTASCTR